MATPSNLIVPLKLDAFVLNAKVCSGEPKDAKIAPITQPNYTFLRIDGFVAQNDVLNHVDLHRTSPADVNSRFSDIGSIPVNEPGKPRHPPRADRVGVYLHWMIPRAYRSGIASSMPLPQPTPLSSSEGGAGAGSAAAKEESMADNTAPVFPAVPNRWLVIRKLHPGFLPANDIIPDVEAWVVESDRRRNINDTADLGRYVDLQVDVSPYVDGSSGSINTQAEVFIGWKGPAAGWKELPDVPRVPLTVLSSSNPLFPDYQPHNSNVFSIVDNFSYTADGEKCYLTNATASYFVVGWHSNFRDDLMAIPTLTPPPNPPSTLETRLSACMMEFDESVLTMPAVETWLKSPASGQSLCHGAMYDVQWNVDEKPTNLPADRLSHHINDKLPVAIGTTPLDSLLAFIQAHKDTEDDETIKQLEDDLIAIQALLISQNDDGVDAQRQATDMLNNQNYDRIEGGTHYHISSSDDTQKPGEPPEQAIKALARLNRLRLAFDTHERTIRRKRWDMFSLWWTYITTLANLKKGNDEVIKQGVDKLAGEIDSLLASAKNLQQEVDNEKAKTEISKAEPGVLPSLYQQRDPTLLVGGIEAGWPHDFLEKLKVRLQEHVISNEPTQPITPASKTMLENVIKNLPSEVQGSTTDLVKEFLSLGPVDGKRLEKAPTDKLLPLYHDQDKTTEQAWRDTWNGQPWFPLFLEWEVEYTHIPFAEWSLEEQTSRQSTDPVLRYGIAGDKDLTKLKDRRMISGRVLILPQPNFSLKSRIDQLFDNTHPEILEEYLPEKERENLRNNLFKLSFVSAPLAGLTDHLLTRVQGSHIKPNTRPPGQKPQPMDEVVTVGKGAGFTANRLELIGQESDLTPYGTLVEVGKDISAFKPVTHGQMRFTKLNIIDKFGQAIHAIDPRIAARSPPMYPCVSELYACQSKKGKPGVANTVGDLPDEPGLCEFVQLPPRINQYARLNSVFVVKGPRGGEEGNVNAEKYWNPMAEWQNPVWGWVVINYADHGVQFFLPDGTFYKAVRAGGRGGATTSPAWLPFGKPTHPTGDQQQLDRLILKLECPIYLQSFVDMINEASRNGPAAPSAYAQFLGSVVGKPLALVNMGWSLELAINILENQSKLVQEMPDKLLDYKFPVKFGDKDRVYDGLVGYFNLTDPKDLDPKDLGGELDLRRIYTYSKQLPSDGSPLRIISKENYPRFQPFWIDPNNGGTDIADNITAANIERLTIFGALIDPFTPLHGYSSFLPTQPLQLPPWTWHTALCKMTAFFHMGPIMVTEGIPPYNKDYKLESNYDLKKLKPPVGAVPIPALALADWNWLQPYIDSTDSTALDGRVFMALGLGKLDNRPRFEKSPYSAIEGYLQLKRPLEPEKPEEVKKPEVEEKPRPRLEEVD